MITVSEVRQATNLPPERDAENISLRAGAIRLWEEKTKKVWDVSSGVIELRTPVERRTPLYLHGPDIEVTRIRTWDRTRADAKIIEDAEVFDLPNFITKIVPVDHLWYHVVELTYNAGWQVIPDEYADIREALLSQILYQLRRFSGDKAIQETQGFEGGSTRFMSGSMSPVFKDAVQRYKRKV